MGDPVENSREYENFPPDGYCLACGARTPAFRDQRTGHWLCHEDAAALISWELDGCPELDEDHWLTGYGRTYAEELPTATALNV